MAAARKYQALVDFDYTPEGRFDSEHVHVGAELTSTDLSDERAAEMIGLDVLQEVQ